VTTQDREVNDDACNSDIELAQMATLAESHKLEAEAARTRQQWQRREREAMKEEDGRSRAWEQVAARTQIRHRRVLEHAMLLRCTTRSQQAPPHHPLHPTQKPFQKSLLDDREREVRQEQEARILRVRNEALEQDKLRRRVATARRSATDMRITEEAEREAGSRAAERERGANEAAAEREMLRLGASRAMAEAEAQGRRLGEAREARRARQHAILQLGMLQEAERGRLDSEITLSGRELVRMAEEDIDVSWKDPSHWISPRGWPWRRERRVFTRGPRSMPGVDLGLVKLNNKLIIHPRLSVPSE